MRPLRSPAVLLLLWLLLLFPASQALPAQSIHSVSDDALRLVPGGPYVTLRIEGTGLAGATEVRFMKDGREVTGLKGELRATDRLIEITIVADRLMNPMEGIDVELRGPRMRQPIGVPSKVLVAQSGPAGSTEREGEKATTGSRPLPPPSDPAPSDPAVQVADLVGPPYRVYRGARLLMRVRLTQPSSGPVEIEIVNERPTSLQSPEVVVVPPGQLEAEFEVEGKEPYIYLGDPWVIELQARKKSTTNGPTQNVRVFEAPTPGLALFPNSAIYVSGYDFGDNSYAAPPAAHPAHPGETLQLQIRLDAEPVIGATLQLTSSGPASVQSTLQIPPSTNERVFSVPVTFGTVSSPQTASITISGFGQQIQSQIEVYPDQVFVQDVAREDCGSCTSAWVVGGDAVRVDVRLSQDAGPGGYAVPIQISDPSALSSVSLTIPAGSDEGLLIIGAQPTDTTRSVTLTVGDVVPHTFTITIQPSGPGPEFEE